MTYSQFLQFIGNAFNLFKDTFLSVADMLIKNYFFITILGIPIFISLIWLVYNLVYHFLFSKIDEYEEYSDRMKNYELNQEVKKSYLKKHRLDDNDTNIFFGISVPPIKLANKQELKEDKK